MKDTTEDKRQRSVIPLLGCSFQVLRVVGNIPEAACFHRPLSLSRPLVSSSKEGRCWIDSRDPGMLLLLLLPLLLLLLLLRLFLLLLLL